ncbi:helix-turn-helix domain-containing protein [Anaerobutyricum hallii]|uniref:Helix-turn-helix domain-containing protein n=1 Tax=Anaerobutyricum hallii TaxID=39488 RepID=A0A415U8W2_9FIRM|nr:helix-turn-helix transcriptional regulator [Anaerobutyricum hallii]RHN14528.1 helix-turn-helix domain-containing protein [Anaerobutyricum hallii]
MSIENNIIGENIKKFRKKANLTQKELANKCGLAEITIRQYETGKREPRREQQEILCDKLGITLADLFSHKQVFSDKKHDIQELIKTITKIIQETKDSDESEQDKSKDLTILNNYLKQVQQLDNTLDLALEADTEFKETIEYIENENSSEIQHEFEELFLISSRMLNNEGRYKLMDYLNLLLKIPEYQKNSAFNEPLTKLKQATESIEKNSNTF